MGVPLDPIFFPNALLAEVLELYSVDRSTYIGMVILVCYGYVGTLVPTEVL